MRITKRNKLRNNPSHKNRNYGGTAAKSPLEKAYKSAVVKTKDLYIKLVIAIADNILEKNGKVNDILHRVENKAQKEKKAQQNKTVKELKKYFAGVEKAGGKLQELCFEIRDDITFRLTYQEEFKKLITDFRNRLVGNELFEELTETINDIFEKESANIEDELDEINEELRQTSNAEVANNRQVKRIATKAPVRAPAHVHAPAPVRAPARRTIEDVLDGKSLRTSSVLKLKLPPPIDLDNIEDLRKGALTKEEVAELRKNISNLNSEDFADVEEVMRADLPQNLRNTNKINLRMLNPNTLRHIQNFVNSKPPDHTSLPKSNPQVVSASSKHYDELEIWDEDTYIEIDNSFGKQVYAELMKLPKNQIEEAMRQVRMSSSLSKNDFVNLDHATLKKIDEHIDTLKRANIENLQKIENMRKKVLAIVRKLSEDQFEEVSQIILDSPSSSKIVDGEIDFNDLDMKTLNRIQEYIDRLNKTAAEQRDKARLERDERLKNAVPLYENNDDDFYRYRSTSITLSSQELANLKQLVGELSKKVDTLIDTVADASSANKSEKKAETVAADASSAKKSEIDNENVADVPFEFEEDDSPNTKRLKEGEEVKKQLTKLSGDIMNLSPEQVKQVSDLVKKSQPDIYNKFGPNFNKYKTSLSLLTIHKIQSYINKEAEALKKKQEAEDKAKKEKADRRAKRKAQGLGSYSTDDEDDEDDDEGDMFGGRNKKSKRKQKRNAKKTIKKKII